MQVNVGNAIKRNRLNIKCICSINMHVFLQCLITVILKYANIQRNMVYAINSILVK